MKFLIKLKRLNKDSNYKGFMYGIVIISCIRFLERSEAYGS